MNELTNTQPNALQRIEQLGQEARALRLSIDVNMWQLARVFVEAKEAVPHGEWQKWLKDNAQVSVRTAEDMIAAYKRFGGMQGMDRIGQSKTFKLLPLPEGTEEAFLKEHDVENMTTREVQEAVKQARAEAQAEIEREKAARMAAERRAEMAESRQTVPEEVAEQMRANEQELKNRKDEIDRLAALGQESLEKQRGLAEENRLLKREIEERDAMLTEQQADYNRVQEELLDAKSALARGDAERAPVDQFTPDAFARAVQGFIGACARMPHMRTAFANMSAGDKGEYAVLLETVEQWCRDSRAALNTVAVEMEVSF